LIAINHFTVNTGDTIVNRTFWVEDGQIFICCIYSMMGQKHLKIYRSADLTSTLTEWFSIPVNAFYYPKQSVKNCGESKLILGVVDKLYLMEQNTTDTNLVSGFIYRDMNNNNVLDAFESLQQPIQLNTSSNLNLFSSNTGKFSFIESVSNDTLRAHTIPYYNCNPTYQLINAGDTGIKFRMIPLASVNDLSVKIIPQNQLIPGTVNQFQMLVKNVGTNTLYNSVVKMRRNGLLNISAIPTPFASSNDSLSWQIDSILPNQTLNFTTNDHLPSQTLVGTMIPVHASVSTLVQDIELSNNRDSLSLITVNTYKGNYKHVSPTSYTVDNLSNQNALTYTIRFQNTNNFQVMNMLIIDTIEPGLDLNSLQMLSASHNYSVQLHPNRVVAFHFNNINLPDSLSHPIESSGYIQYAIQPYSTWSIGDSIRNKASIYFDVTNMTQTNTVSSVLSTTVDLNNTASNSDGIYPNPFSHEIHIQNSKGHTIELYSIDGQLILQKMIHAEHETIQLNFLCEGIYLVKNTDLDGQLISKKLIKQ
jgi:hypothetical protein